MGSKCKTCKHWKNPKQAIRSNYFGEGPEEQDMGFLIGDCDSDKLSPFTEPDHSDGVMLQDGSDYRVSMHPAENYGCVNHEEQK